MSKYKSAHELFKKWKKDPEYRKEYKVLEEEFSVASALIQARTQANLTQAEVARRMNTTQSVVARLEGGANLSLKMLRRYAQATDTRINIELLPTK